jgi:hypothetical protein
MSAGPEHASKIYIQICEGEDPRGGRADDSSGGASVKMTFERVIVWPDGRREIEGVTPKALPAPEPDSSEVG